MGLTDPACRCSAETEMIPLRHALCICSTKGHRLFDIPRRHSHSFWVHSVWIDMPGRGRGCGRRLFFLHGLRCDLLMTMIMVIVCATASFCSSRHVIRFVHEMSLKHALRAERLKIAVGIGRKGHARKVAWHELSAKFPARDPSR